MRKYNLSWRKGEILLRTLIPFLNIGLLGLSVYVLSSVLEGAFLHFVVVVYLRNVCVSFQLRLRNHFFRPYLIWSFTYHFILFFDAVVPPLADYKQSSSAWLRYGYQDGCRATLYSIWPHRASGGLSIVYRTVLCLLSAALRMTLGFQFLNHTPWPIISLQTVNEVVF